MFELKRLTPEGVEIALRKVERYRLLNEPWQAESICLDILELDPDHQEALVSLILSITDQFKAEEGKRKKEALELIPRLRSEYQREYYSGIIWERRATTLLARRSPGFGPVAYQHLRRAMKCYERAEQLETPGDDPAIVRWNSCARMIMRHKEIRPAAEETREVFLE